MKIKKSTLTLTNIFLFSVIFTNQILQAARVSENQPVGTEITLLGNLFGNGTFSLVEGEGSNDNSLFSLSKSGILRSAKVFDFERANEYSIRFLRSSPIVKDFDTEGGHSLFVLSDGSFWGVGRNDLGQLGEKPKFWPGTTSYHSIRSRKLIEKTGVKRAKAVGTINGEAETYCLKDNGALWRIGTNQGATLNKVEIVNAGVNQFSVAGMDRKVFYTKEGGSLYLCSEDPNSPDHFVHTKLENSGVTKIVRGRFGGGPILYLKTDGSLWKIEKNDDPLLSGFNLPQKIQTKGVISMAVSPDNGDCFFIKNDGSLWFIGGNGNVVRKIENSGVVKVVSPLSEKGVYLKEDGSLWVSEWSADSENIPFLLLREISDFSATLNTILVIKNDGSLWGRGNNLWGQLGEKWFTHFIHQEWVNVIDGKVKNISISPYNTLVQKEDNSLWTLGVVGFKDHFRFQKFSGISVAEEVIPGGLGDKEFTLKIKIMDVDENIRFSLDKNFIKETESKNALVGTFTSENSDLVSYSLVHGEGATDNKFFTITLDGKLKTAKTLDYESSKLHSIRVKAISAGKQHVEKIFKIHVLDVDERVPLNFFLSSSSVSENEEVGTVVGKFQTKESSEVSYSLVAGIGGAGNLNFTLSTNGVLETAESFDFEDIQGYNIRVIATASGRMPTEKIFRISILDVDEDPVFSEINLSNASVQENIPLNSLVGVLSVKEDSAANFSLEPGRGDSGNIFFNLTKNGELRTSKILTRTGEGLLSVRVRASNKNGKEVIQIFKITITSNPFIPPEPPTPFDDWKKKWEELVKVMQPLREELDERNVFLDEKKQRLTFLEKEQAEIKEKIAELGLDVSSKQERIASLNKEVEQARAKLELEELAQANLLAEISEEEGIFEKRKTESDQLSEQVEGIESTLASLNLKLKVPHVRGWHYATEKGWMWTDLDFYPLVFFIDKNKWFEYEQGSAHPWIYKDIETNTLWQWSE